MTPLIHYATAGIMLVHALLGCGSHHERCCAAEVHEGGAVHADSHTHQGECSGHFSPLPEQPPRECLAHAGLPQECLPQEGPTQEGLTQAGLEHGTAAPESSVPGAPQPCESGYCAFVLSALSGVNLELACEWFDAARWAEAEQAAVASSLAGGPPAHHGPPLAERVQAEYCIWLI